MSAAIEALREEAEAVQAAGDLPRIKSLRNFEPGQRVHARLEISTGRMLRRREAGVDVMGDGSLVPYTGGTFKQRLAPADSESAFDAVRQALVT